MEQMQELPAPDQQQAPVQQDQNAQVPIAEVDDMGVRNFRPRRLVYSQADRDRAIQMLNSGVSCREVAKSLGPRCSSGTPIRWRKLKLKQEESRRLMQEMMQRPGNAVNVNRW